MVLFGPHTIANTTTNQDELRQSHVIISWIQSKICMKLEREQDPRDAVSSFRKNFTSGSEVLKKVAILTGETCGIRNIKEII